MTALNTNVHFHTLAAQGVFFEKGAGAVGFAPAAAPTDREVARLLATVRRRIVRLIVELSSYHVGVGANRFIPSIRLAPLSIERFAPSIGPPG